MIDKWADYLISAVRYEDHFNRKSISHCKVHPDNGDSVGDGTTWSKDEIMEALMKGYTFNTISKDDRGKWKRGINVFLLMSNEIYLNTDGRINEDYLLNTPEF
ncbi:MAG: DUF3892 domain-containing protein [Ignavibacteria bacterium]|jgi:hypothetical protein